MNDKIKLWMGVGAWVLASTSPVALLASGTLSPAYAAEQGGEGGETGATPTHRHGDEGGESGGSAHKHHAAQAGEGGEGGESAQGGEGGEAGHGGADPLASADPDVAYATRLLLIKGHLRIGRELVQTGNSKAAQPHFMHPAEEIYSDLSDGLKDRRVAPFKAKLDALSRVAEKGDDKAFEAAYESAVSAVDAAWSGLPEARRNAPGLGAKTISALAASAAAEYAEAIEGDRFANVVEYQDSRGFLLEARDLFARSRAALEAKDAETTGRMAKVLDEMLVAWPAALPPAKPAKSPGDIAALASRLELVAGDFD